MADGQVRCGRCHTQFDALERLIEEGDPDAAESGSFLQTPPTHEDEPLDVEEPDSVEEITLEGKHIEVSGTYRVLDEDTHESHIRQEVREEWAQIPDEEPDASNDEAIEVAAAEEDPFEPPVSVRSGRATRAPLGARLNSGPAETIDEPPFIAVAPRRAPSSRVWTFAALPLALFLIAQVVHHYRAELARHPQVGAPLMGIYDVLGLSLTPDWNLHAYGVKQWGVVTDASAPGTLKVRASITNGAAFAQPYPLLKLVLEDRWGDQVRAREFEPEEYLDPGTAPDRLLGPTQQTNATISIVDPGPDAEGFRFDVCLRGKSGPVCAADVPQ